MQTPAASSTLNPLYFPSSSYHCTTHTSHTHTHTHAYAHTHMNARARTNTRTRAHTYLICKPTIIDGCDGCKHKWLADDWLMNWAGVALGENSGVITLPKQCRNYDCSPSVMSIHVRSSSKQPCLHLKKCGKRSIQLKETCVCVRACWWSWKIIECLIDSAAPVCALFLAADRDVSSSSSSCGFTNDLYLYASSPISVRVS